MSIEVLIGDYFDSDPILRRRDVARHVAATMRAAAAKMGANVITFTSPLNAAIIEPATGKSYTSEEWSARVREGVAKLQAPGPRITVQGDDE